MDELAIDEAVTALYQELIDKIIAKQPLSARENIAYHTIDFRVRLETGALDGIIGDPQPYVEALQQVGLRTHADLLREILARFPQAKKGQWTPEEVSVWEAREEALLAMMEAHEDYDFMEFDRAAYAFWKATRGED